MRQIKLVIEYDGTSLCGWQRQPNGPTVQQHIEEALTKLLTHDVRITGASRTDAGVHARGQVASFQTDRPIELHGIRRGLNSMLPDAIAVREVSEVELDFHPRFSATGKHYRYLIYRGADRSPRWRERAWHHPLALDLAPMRAAAASLVGEHDFAAFRAVGCAAKTTVRRIHGIDLTEARAEPIDSPPRPEAGNLPTARAPLVGAPDELLAIDVRGNAFLRNMVRIVVGTLAEVGRGYRESMQVVEILIAKDRNQAGMTAPAHGLELIEVRYDGVRAPRV